MLIAPSSRIICSWITITIGMLLTGCDPTVYKKPLQDFQDATRQLREAYFLQLDIAKEAIVEDFTVDQKRPLWGNPQLKSDKQAIQDAAQRIANERQKDALNKDILAIRNKAFDTVDAYAGILLSLASNDDTNAIADDVKGLVGDLEKLVAVAEKTKGLSDIGTRAADWLGPLGSAVTAFNEIFKLISAVARDRAIRETIVTADPAIQRLLNILGDEAAYALSEARDKYSSAERKLQTQLKAGVVDDAAARELSDMLGIISFKSKQLGKVDDLKKLFDAAREAQSALVRKAAKPDYQEFLVQIRSFKAQAVAVRQALDTVRHDR